jgi:hypothetical protein
MCQLQVTQAQAMCSSLLVQFKEINMQAKSNKPRGPVLINEEINPGTNKTANPNRKPVNQARGPVTGNAGTPVKQKSFLAEKSDRGSYMASLANMVSSAFGQRGQGMKPNQPNPAADKTALQSISPNTKTRRGPTRG